MPNGSLSRKTGFPKLANVRLRSGMGGFSMVELLLVVAIVLILSAISLPSFTELITSARLRGGMGDLSGLFQNARNVAVRQNTISRVHFEVSNNRQVAFVDWVNCGSVGWCGLSASTPQIWLPQQFTQARPPTGGTGEPTALDNATCGTNAASTLDTTPTDDTYFNQLGIPCQYDSTTNPSCSGSQAFAYYFNYLEASRSPRWAALCVSPAGRIKAWYWTGTSWTN